MCVCMYEFVCMFVCECLCGVCLVSVCVCFCMIVWDFECV